MNTATTNSALAAFAPLAGRILLSAIFISSGLAKVTGFEGTVGYIASKGLPLPELLAAGGAGLELLAGIALLIGFQARLAALALAAFTIVAAVLFHNYWTLTDPMAAYMEQIMFWKNVAISGGMLYVARFGAGAYAVDNVLAGRGRTIAA